MSQKLPKIFLLSVVAVGMFTVAVVFAANHAGSDAAGVKYNDYLSKCPSTLVDYSRWEEGAREQYEQGTRCREHADQCYGKWQRSDLDITSREMNDSQLWQSYPECDKISYDKRDACYAEITAPITAAYERELEANMRELDQCLARGPIQPIYLDQPLPTSPAREESFSELLYRKVAETLDGVPLPQIPENVNYEQCGLLCSYRDDRGYHGRLINACGTSEILFQRDFESTFGDWVGQSFGSLCSQSAYQRMSRCWSEQCGLTRILAGPRDGHGGGIILRVEAIQETTKISLGELKNKQPKITDVGIGDQLPPESFVLHTEDKQYNTPSGNIVRVEPRTSVVFQLRSATAVELQLLSGSVEVKTESEEKIKIVVPQGEVENDGTHFWVQVTDEGHTIIGVYEGAVTLTSYLTGETQQVTPATDGTPGVAALQYFTAEELGLVEPEKRGGAWLWILLPAILAGAGYLGYRNKDALLRIIKKEPGQ